MRSHQPRFTEFGMYEWEIVSLLRTRDRSIPSAGSLCARIVSHTPTFRPISSLLLSIRFLLPRRIAARLSLSLFPRTIHARVLHIFRKERERERERSLINFYTEEKWRFNREINTENQFYFSTDFSASLRVLRD